MEKGHYLEGSSPYTLIHSACFGNEIETVKYLVDVLKKEPTPQCYE